MLEDGIIPPFYSDNLRDDGIRLPSVLSMSILLQKTLCNVNYNLLYIIILDQWVSNWLELSIFVSTIYSLFVFENSNTVFRKDLSFKEGFDN